MATATIPLAQNKFKPEKVTFPAYLSTKVDGVPVKWTVENYDRNGWSLNAQSRAGKPLPSVDNYGAEFLHRLITSGYDLTGVSHFVAEITHETFTDFKDIAGVVRKQTPQTGLIFNFFDLVMEARPECADFSARTRALSSIIARINEEDPDDNKTFRYIHQSLVFDIDDLAEQIALKRADEPDAEGMIVRSGDATFKPNSRHWDYQKILVKPTADLRILRFEEAISKDGEPKGMVGRVIAEYKGTEIGVGPGKLTHAERTALWERQQGGKDTWGIAQVEYKKDDSYEALREPTFQHWRLDKAEPSYE